MFWSAIYLGCVVYTKTIILLSVGESDGYLPPLRRIIINYIAFIKRDLSILFFVKRLIKATEHLLC